MGLSVVCEGVGTGCAKLRDDRYLDVGGGVFGRQGDWTCDCDGCEQHCGESGELHDGYRWFWMNEALRVRSVESSGVVLSWVSRMIVEGNGAVLLCEKHRVVVSLHRHIVTSLHCCIAGLSG